MKQTPTSQKLRGGYYTPPPIADFLTKWAIPSTDIEVLEPSCGDGIFLVSAARRFLSLGLNPELAANHIFGVEYDKEEVAKTIKNIQTIGLPISNNHIHAGDFFLYCKEHLVHKRYYDAIVGNPPFIRYQNFIEEHRAIAFDLMTRMGLHPNRLTNSWVPFLIASTLLLKSGGRLAMVIPAELFQVNYAAETRRFLSDFFSRITLVTFKKLVFQEVQQEIVLLLGEKNGNERHGIKVVELDSMDDLAGFNHAEIESAVLKPMDHSTEKWTQYFLDNHEIDLLRSLRTHQDLQKAGEYIDVDVGVVTGQNEFFALNKEKIEELGLRRYVVKLVSRSIQLKGAVFSDKDWESNTQMQNASYLLTFPPKPVDALPKYAQRYIASGEKHGFHKGYKCSIRNPWYVVPSVWAPHAFMLRQIHSYPKLVLNTTTATCTDTVHRVKFFKQNNSKHIVAAFTNSLTFAFSEVIGRSYGGGVMTFEPTEAERIPLPFMNVKNLDLYKVDTLLRKNDVRSALEYTDRVLLLKGLGLTEKDVKCLRGIWEKLSDRRIKRKRR